MKKVALFAVLLTLGISTASFADVSADNPPAPAPATPVAPTPAPVMSSSCGPEDTAAIACASNVLRQRSYYGHTGLCDLECFDSNGSSGWRFAALQVRPDLETQIRFSCLPHIGYAFQACGF